MADVRSKNLYELLGNDPDLDSDREPEPPTRAVDKSATRLGKRDAPKEAPLAPRGGASSVTRGRGGRGGGNEEAFRDRQAGSYSNRARPVDENKESQRRGIRARDDRGGRVRNDRHSRTGHTDTNKQVEQGWGAKAGDATWTDEKAAEAIAKIDETEPQPPVAEGEVAEAQEPADKTKSFADYLAEQETKRNIELGIKEARAPNEGMRGDKKWKSAKELKRDDDEDAYIRGRESASKRERQRKEKNFLDVDMRFVEQPRGRGSGGRGGRARGGDRGRGGRSGYSGPTVDEKNFPSLGSK